jgi:hypothetical protein
MKKSNANIFSLSSLTPAEEKAILLNFEQFVAAYPVDNKNTCGMVKHLPAVPKSKTVQYGIS